MTKIVDQKEFKPILPTPPLNVVGRLQRTQYAVFLVLLGAIIGAAPLAIFFVNNILRSVDWKLIAGFVAYFGLYLALLIYLIRLDPTETVTVTAEGIYRKSYFRPWLNSYVDWKDVKSIQKYSIVLPFNSVWDDFRDEDFLPFLRGVTFVDAKKNQLDVPSTFCLDRLLEWAGPQNTKSPQR